LIDSENFIWKVENEQKFKFLIGTKNQSVDHHLANLWHKKPMKSKISKDYDYSKPQNLSSPSNNSDIINKSNSIHLDQSTYSLTNNYTFIDPHTRLEKVIGLSNKKLTMEEEHEIIRR